MTLSALSDEEPKEQLHLFWEMDPALDLGLEVALLLSLSGEEGLVTAADWVPKVLLLQLAGLAPRSLGLLRGGWSEYQSGRFSRDRDWDTLIWWVLGLIHLSDTWSLI